MPNGKARLVNVGFMPITIEKAVVIDFLAVVGIWAFNGGILYFAVYVLNRWQRYKPTLRHCYTPAEASYKACSASQIYLRNVTSLPAASHCCL